MKVKLNGLDRLIIPEILPQQGGRLEMMVREEIVDIIKINSSEFEGFGLYDLGNGQVQFDQDKILGEKEFDLKKPQTDFLKESVRKLDEKKMWTPRNTKTCLKIEKMR